MFEKINQEKSEHNWRTLEEKESVEYFNNQVEKLKNTIYRLKQTPDTDRLQTELINKKRNLKEDIVSTALDEVLYLAYDNTACLNSGFSGVVYLDLETAEIFGKPMSTGQQLQDQDIVEIYRLENNWIGNNDWRVNDVLNDEEYKKLKDKYGEDADFLDREQLESINIDYDTRLLEYLRWVENN